MKERERRNHIGHEYEFDHTLMFKRHEVEYESNPIFYWEWVKNNHKFKGFDALVKTPKGNIKIEVKYTNYDIPHSWFLRDWISRNADIISTNCKWRISYEDRMLLKEKGIKLMNRMELLNYLLKLHRTPNKYVLSLLSNFHSVYTSLYPIQHVIHYSSLRSALDSAQNNPSKNDGKFVSSVGLGYSVPPESTISLMSLACFHANSVGFSSTYTMLSGRR